MPLYEFYCADCRSKFEVLTSYEASQAGMVCASCHGQNVRKLLSVFARPSHGGSDGDDFVAAVAAAVAARAPAITSFRRRRVRRTQPVQ